MSDVIIEMKKEMTMDPFYYIQENYSLQCFITQQCLRLIFKKTRNTRTFIDPKLMFGLPPPPLSHSSMARELLCNHKTTRLDSVLSRI